MNEVDLYGDRVEQKAIALKCHFIKESNMTEIHNEGCECELCRWANSTTAIPAAPDFDREWREAPESRRRYTERSEAEWWLMRGLWLGIQYERERGLLAVNGDLREMQRMARERINVTT